MSGILAAAGRAVARRAIARRAVAAGLAAVVCPLVGLIVGAAVATPSAVPRDLASPSAVPRDLASPPAVPRDLASPSAVPRDPADSGPAITQLSGPVMDIPGRETEVSPTAAPRRAPASSDGIATTGVASAGRWSWPLAPAPAVVERFLPPPHPWSAGHRGVDLAAAVGQPVLAPDAGVVTFSRLVAGRGVVVVTHAGGLRSTFEPVDQVLPVGTLVTRGQPVATVAASPGHCAPATCLHWGVLRGDVYLDPLSFVGLLKVILLPLA